MIEIDNTEYHHLVNEVEWYKKRMSEYRDSFWSVVNLVIHSDCPEEVKAAVLAEYNKY